MLGFRPCWCPSPFPSPSISRCFLFTLLHQPLDFIRLFFTVAVSAPHHQPSSLFQTWDWHYGTWISKVPEYLSTIQETMLEWTTILARLQCLSAECCGALWQIEWECHRRSVQLS